jgi:hypothetical protein
VIRRGALALVAALAAALGVSVAGARAADECRGLMVCISVPGPWVVVPAEAAGAAYPASSWLLTCPREAPLIGGLDARLTRAEIDIGFRGLLGSPVNPGITTENAALFTGTYTGSDAVATAYKPFIGCVPTSGGARTPTVYRPGKPTIAHAKVVAVKPGRLARVTHGCRPGEHLISWTYAVGIYGSAAPSARVLAGARASAVVRNGRILASASRAGVPSQRRVELQVVAICTRSPED